VIRTPELVSYTFNNVMYYWVYTTATS